jgi:heme o synthase
MTPTADAPRPLELPPDRFTPGPRSMSWLRFTRNRLKPYWELTKPRVVTLIAFTAVVGMFLATPGFVPLDVLVLATLGISLAAGSAAAFNHILEQRVDAIMVRTRARPLPAGKLTQGRAIIFAAILALLSMTILMIGVNTLTGALTFLTLIGYSVIYTLFLKPATPQNIVIGGAAGAAPPVLGWTAVTGNIGSDALLLFLIVFVWTPPHFWSLALYREKEYAKVGIPMLPVTHGSEFTRQYILLYTILLAAITLLPFATRMSGLFYLVGAVALNAGFIGYAWKLYRNYSDALARKTFGYSIRYLAALFALLLVDHYRSLIYAALQVNV